MEKESSKTGATLGKGRLEALDLYKFFILIIMIQGHLFREYLLPPLRQTGWFALHEIFHGVIGPAFLFASGFAAFLSYSKKKIQYTFSGRAYYVRIRRILFLIGIGYWVHLPYLSFWKILQELPGGKTVDFLRCDILQCIGIGLLLFALLAGLVKKEGWLVTIVAIMAAAFFLLPETVKDARLPFALRTYLSHELSFFPLFPWAGYLFIGIITAFLYTRLEETDFFRGLLLLGTAAFPWYFLHRGVPGEKAELTLSGNLTKAGGVFLLLAFCRWLTVRFHGRWLALLQRAGRESLFVYVLHLFIIFSSAFAAGFQLHFKDALTLKQALLLLPPVVIAVFAPALLYVHAKDRHPKLWRYGFVIFWVGFWIVFLVRPN